MNCGCESGNRYEFNLKCMPCMARHYVLVLGTPETPHNKEYQKARRAQLKRLLTPEQFEEFKRLVLEQRAKNR